MLVLFGLLLVCWRIEYLMRHERGLPHEWWQSTLVSALSLHGRLAPRVLQWFWMAFLEGLAEVPWGILQI